MAIGKVRELRGGRPGHGAVKTVARVLEVGEANAPDLPRRAQEAPRVTKTPQ